MFWRTVAKCSFMDVLMIVKVDGGFLFKNRCCAATVLFHGYWHWRKKERGNELLCTFCIVKRTNRTTERQFFSKIKKKISSQMEVFVSLALVKWLILYYRLSTQYLPQETRQMSSVVHSLLLVINLFCPSRTVSKLIKIETKVTHIVLREIDSNRKYKIEIVSKVKQMLF